MHYIGGKRGRCHHSILGSVPEFFHPCLISFLSISLSLIGNENFPDIVTRGNSELVFALTRTLITHATITHKQYNGLALVLTHSYTITCPTTVEKEVFMRYSVCSPPRNKRFATKRGNSDSCGVIQTTMLMTY